MTELGPNNRSWNQQVIDTYRANGGEVGCVVGGVSLLLLTTQGRRTGKPHTTPVVSLRDGARHLIFASNAGGATDPDWYRNLLVHPQVTIELPDESGVVEPWAAAAAPLEDAERGEAWERLCTIDPTFRDYERRTTRTIPVVALVPLDPSDLASSPELRRGLGEALITGHDTLRAQLTGIRSRIDAVLVDPTPAAYETLHQRCLTYCYGLQVHHLREDGAFSPLARHMPELVPVLQRLRAEHERLEGALTAFEALLDPGPARDRAGVEALHRALDDVEAGLEDHFAEEEAHLLPAMDVARPSRAAS